MNPTPEQQYRLACVSNAPIDPKTPETAKMKARWLLETALLIERQCQAAAEAEEKARREAEEKASAEAEPSDPPPAAKPARKRKAKE